MGDPWDENGELVATVRGLCGEVRDAVRPRLGSFSAKELEGRGASGDTTFGIDEVAELKVSEFLDGRGDIAYYTEDRGLVASPGARYLLIIDPIDGTRSAAVGLESCCVSVAAALLEGRDPCSLTLADVLLGVVTEIKNDAVFTALRGAGAVIEVDGANVPPALSTTTSVNEIFWTAGYRGRPAEALTTVMSELIDLSSVDGGYFDLGSATYSITRIVTGQMDAYVDVGQRMVEELPEVRDLFLEVGHGSILNNFPYDLAAAALIASECGAPVTDAAGAPLDDRPLVPAGGLGQLSTLVCSNAALHAAVLERLDEGMRRLACRLGRA
jgi:myo-inositol-1(or 4)-monophosphatase